MLCLVAGVPPSRHSVDLPITRRSGPSGYASLPPDPSPYPRRSYRSPTTSNSRNLPNTHDARQSRPAYASRESSLTPAPPPTTTTTLMPAHQHNADHASIAASRRIPHVPGTPIQNLTQVQGLLSHRSSASDVSLCNIGGASLAPGQWMLERDAVPYARREVAPRTASGFTSSFEQRNFAVGYGTGWKRVGGRGLRGGGRSLSTVLRVQCRNASDWWRCLMSRGFNRFCADCCCVGHVMLPLCSCFNQKKDGLKDIFFCQGWSLVGGQYLYQ